MSVTGSLLKYLNLIYLSLIILVWLSSFHSLYRPVSYKMNTVVFSVHSSSAEFENFWLWVQTSSPAGAFVCAYVGFFQSAPSKHMHVKLIADFKLAAE